jgi:hypothetical protein
MKTSRITPLTLFGYALAIVLFPCLSHGDTMDGRAAEKLPELKSLIKEVRNSHQLKEPQRNFLIETFDSGDTVLISLAAYVVGLTEGEETNLCAKAETVLKLIDAEFDKIEAEKAQALNPPPPPSPHQSISDMVREMHASITNRNLTVKTNQVTKRSPFKANPMSQAFIRLMLTKKKIPSMTLTEQEGHYKALIKDRNPFMKIEAAKELLKLDPEEGQKAIKALVTDQDPAAKFEAMRQLQALEKPEHYAMSMDPDELYATYLITVEEGTEFDLKRLENLRRLRREYDQRR